MGDTIAKAAEMYTAIIWTVYLGNLAKIGDRVDIRRRRCIYEILIELHAFDNSIIQKRR